MPISMTPLFGNRTFSFDPSGKVAIHGPESASLDEYVPHAAVAGAREELLEESYRWALHRVWLTTADGSALPEDLTEHGVKAQAVLFNVVVAVEWVPGPVFLAELVRAFTRASELLYDVTDGYMAIEQVVIGGMELMPVADIQLFASNRLLPRSSVFGLLDEAEYRPIRIGRGLWDKREHTAIPWPEGHGALVHEWCHYALGLKDQYLQVDKTAGDGLVVPQLSLTVNSIMARGTSTELLGTRKGNVRSMQEKPDSDWAQINQRRTILGLPDLTGHKPEEDPPAILPRPVFYVQDDSGATETLALSLVERFPQELDTEHCWVYLLRERPGERRLIQQGTIDETVDTGGMLLLGARTGDSVVLLGCDEDGAPLVYRGAIAESEDGQAKVSDWDNVTPERWPLVAVLPGQPPAPAENDGPRPTDRLTVRVVDDPAARVEVFSIGGLGPVKQEADGSYIVTSLDGAVLLRWGSGRNERLAICHYSQGGSPDGGYPAHPNPLPSGSGEGNAMLFFYDEQMPEPGSGASLPEGYGKDSRRIVTTTNYQVPAPDGRQARSYVFAVASNFWMNVPGDYPPEKASDLDPTLILYFDGEGTPGLDVHRRAESDWEAIGGRLFASDYFVAAPLTSERAANLYRLAGSNGLAPTRPEFFRLLQSRE